MHFLKFKVLALLLSTLASSPLGVRCRVQSTIKITSILDPPYLSLRSGVSKVSQGNELFEGYCKDLADMISAKLHFKYEMHLVKDSSYGRRIGNGIMNWTGMIGEIVNQQADLAISSMAITSARASVVDFSMPFLQLRLGILMKSSEPDPTPSQFLILQPFSGSLWVAFMALILTFLFIIYATERLVPKFSTLDAGVSEKKQVRLCSPRTKAGKILKGLLLISIGVFVAAYVANFPARREGRASPIINGIQDLASQKDIQYGVVREGSTAAFLLNSRSSLHNQILRNILRAETFTSSSTEGIRRVLNGSYAFITEELSAKYAAAQNCQLAMVPNTFGPLKSFGIAMRRDYELLQPINLAILELVENGDLEALERKWWNNEIACPSSTRRKSTRSSRESQLNVSNMSGLIYLLIVFVLASILIAIFEIRWPDRNILQMRSFYAVAQAEAPIPSSTGQAALEEIELSEIHA